ncbi:methyl-accepting chemotaxis protein [Gammaproteobacteria bacterium]
MRINLPVTSQERKVLDGMQIVSKTDLNGVITYANPDFMEISGFSEQELLGAPHNLVRHPDMPAVAFQGLWDQIQAGRPWSGVVKNRCKNGDYYWVEAHVTPLHEGGRITGYMSVRRRASPKQVEEASRLYEKLRSGKPPLGARWLGRLAAWGNGLGVGPRLGVSFGGLFLVAFTVFFIFIIGDLDRATRNILLAGGGAMLLLVLFVTWLISRSLTRPLRQATAAFDRIAEGYYHNPIDITRDDEVGRVLQGLKSMQIKLDFEFNYTRRVAEESQRIRTALDNVSTNVMIADRAGTIIYVNPALVRMLAQAETEIRSVLPHFDHTHLIGQNLDRFHRDPAHQRRLLEGLRGTHRAAIHVGGRDFDLVANPVLDGAGKHLGSVVEWTDSTALHQVQREVEGVVSSARVGDISGRLDLAGKEGFFRELGGGINRLLETVAGAVGDIDSALMRIAGGDLTIPITNDYQGAFGTIRDNANGTMDSLAALVGRIKEAAAAIATAAREIAVGHGDLSQRTEQQAAALEETSSILEELTATVRQNAANATQADHMAKGACEVAERGRALVDEVVTTMGALQESSTRIADITSVIDGIAFQTNILALNAAVEAARAGEQGRGFAVVAGEVRSLAARSATAAREIKTLIEDSTGKVRTGGRQVEQAGRTMHEIVTAIERASRLMDEISTASHEQTNGIEQIGQAVTRLDEGIQQNASLVEQATTAAESMKGQAEQLLAGVTVFRLPGEQVT